MLVLARQPGRLCAVLTRLGHRGSVPFTIFRGRRLVESRQDENLSGEVSILTVTAQSANCLASLWPAPRDSLTQTALETLAYLAEAYRLAVTPYTDLERVLLADATGFSSRLVSNWLDHSTAENEGRAVTNYRDETMWLKFHAVVGRVSHAILGFRLTPPRGAMSADATLFSYLLDDVVRAGFAPQFVGADNIYLTPANWEACRNHDAYLVCPEKGRNRSKKTGQPIGVGKQMAELRAMFPETVEELKRARQAIEGVFSVEKRDDNHLAAAGTKKERQAFRNALAGNPEIADVINDVEYGLYVSRLVEIYVRAIRQVLRRTVNMELRWKCQISYQHGTKFPVLRG